MDDRTIVKLAKIHSIVQPIGWGLAGLIFGKSMGIPPVEIPMGGYFGLLSMGSFLGSLGILCGSAFSGFLTVEFIERSKPAVRPLVNMSYQSETVAIHVAPGEAQRIDLQKEFGIDPTRVILFCGRVAADREFSTAHYSDVSPRGRPNYEKFRIVFRDRGLAFRGKGDRWFPTERGVRFARVVAEKLANSPTGSSFGLYLKK